MTSLTRRTAMQLAGVSALSLGVGVYSATAASPKKGGRLRLGVSGAHTTDSLDPGTWASSFMQVGMLGGVYNRLSEADEDGNIKPELAESWEASPDARVWTFKLRKDVEFHNGKTFEAEDVIASINHHRGKDTKSAASGVIAPIKDVRADGKGIVVFELEAGNADFPFVVNDYHLPMLQAKDGKADWQTGNGTGGYTVTDYEPGVRLIMKRHPNYWKEGRAHFDEVELIAISDVVARMTALTTGEVDVIDGVDIKTAHLLARNKNIAIDEVTGMQHYTIPMFTDTAPFDDNNVRMALKHAVNREEMVQKILRGHGTVANDHPIAPSNRFFNEELEQRSYDPDKAKFYLKQAGNPNLSVNLSAAEAAFGGAVDAAVLFREHAAKAGIDIKVVREPNDGYWSNVWLKKPFVMSFWAGRPTEDWMFSIAYAAGANWNDTHWTHERFNRLLVEARAELNEDKRREMYYEMQQLCRDEGGAIVPMYANFLDARSVKVTHGPKIASNWELDGHMVIERWWFA